MTRRSHHGTLARVAARSLADVPAPGASAVTTVSDVAEVVWRAANDPSGRLRYPAGADAVALAGSE